MQNTAKKSPAQRALPRGRHLLKTAPGGPALKHEMLFHAASYEHRMQGGSKPIFHLEAFAAKFMAVYKKRSMAGPR